MNNEGLIDRLGNIEDDIKYMKKEMEKLDTKQNILRKNFDKSNRLELLEMKKEIENHIEKHVCDDLIKPKFPGSTSYLFTYDEIAERWDTNKTKVCRIAKRNTLNRRGSYTKNVNKTESKNREEQKEHFCDECEKYCDAIEKTRDNVYDYKDVQISLHDERYLVCETCGSEVYDEEVANETLQRLGEIYKGDDNNE